MRKSKQIALAAAAAVTSIAGQAAHAAVSYTWGDLAGGTQSWTDTTQWSPTGSPTGAATAGDSANLNVALSSNLLINVPTGNYYVDNLKLGSTSTAVTTDVGNANSGGGTLILDGGNPAANAYADIYSLGAAGSTNIISAPIQLDEQSFSTQTVNEPNGSVFTGSDGNYILNTTGSISSNPIGPLISNMFASVIIDPSSTNNLTLNGPISQTGSVSAAILNLMTGGHTLTINGGITITNVNTTSTVGQSFTIGGSSLSTTVINGTIADGALTGSTVSYGYTNPTKVTVYPAITPTIVINSANTYTGNTTMNMSTIIVANDQAFGVQAANPTPSQTGGELRLGGSANEFGYNLEAANDSITINNGIDVGQFLTIEGQHSLTINGYMYQTTQREIINLLPAGKTLTINGQIYCQSATQNNPARVWTFDGSGLTVVNGSIHNSALDDTSITGPVTKNGTGVVLLDGTTATYDGVTTVNGGLLEFAAPGSYGVQTGDTGTSTITVNGGGAVALDSNAGGTAGTTDSSFLSRINPSSTGALALGTLDATANLNFTTGTLANLATMSVGGDYEGVTYTGTITPANNTYRLGGGGTLTMPNTAGNALTGASAGLLVTNGGSVALGGSNNYGGVTTIQGVYVASDAARAAANDYTQPIGAYEPTTLSVNELANGLAATGSGIGSASNIASNLVISGGTLQYTGTGSSTDRLFTVTPVGATLDASGTGAVDFTNTGAITEMDQAPITNVTATIATTGVPFNIVTLPAGTSTGMLAIGMTVTDSESAFPAGSTIVGVSNNAIYLNNNVTTTVLGDTLTFGNQNRTLTLTGTSTAQNVLSAAIGNSATGKVTVNKTGAGTWVLMGNNTYSGGTNVSAGTLVDGTSSSLPANAVATVSGSGDLQLGTSIGLATFKSLTLSGNGTFDVNNDHAIINYGSGPDPIASIAALLKTGYNGGNWNGVGGIISTAAQVNNATSGNLLYGVGYADFADTGNPAGLLSGQLEIKYTLLGDANLSGVVDGTDFGIVAANFNKGVTGWDQGDFNYDNVVDGTDFGDLAANFNKGASGAAVGEPAIDDPAIVAFAQANGLMADLTASVPEPMSLGLLAVGAAGILGRRRRR